MKRYLALTLLICLTVFNIKPGFAVGPLHFNTSIKPPFSTKEYTGFFDLLLEELGRRIGQPIEIVRLPNERALVWANEGRSDGELPRIAGIHKKYTNLIQVEEKIIDYNFVAFAREDMALISWDDLAEKRIGYLIGWKIFENNVPSTAHVEKLRKSCDMFSMLHAERIDVALYERYVGRHFNAECGSPEIREVAEPLAVKPMYMYVHKSHADIVPQITEALKTMKADGTYQRIYDQTLTKGNE